MEALLNFAKGEVRTALAGMPEWPEAPRQRNLVAIVERLETVRKLGVGADRDPTAQRIVMDRLCPRRRERPIEFALPPIRTASDVVPARDAIAQGVASGELMPGEASALTRLHQLAGLAAGNC